MEASDEADARAFWDLVDLTTGARTASWDTFSAMFVVRDEGGGGASCLVFALECVKRQFFFLLLTACPPALEHHHDDMMQMMASRLIFARCVDVTDVSRQTPFRPPLFYTSVCLHALLRGCLYLLYLLAVSCGLNG